MFVDRLTAEQMYAFGQSLTTVFPEVPKDTWRIYVNTLPNCDSVRISIITSYDKSYNMIFVITNFSISFFDAGLIYIDFATTKFIQFMYRIFGDEYKEAFIKNAIKPFDEVT